MEASQELIGLPSAYFADEEMLGAKVRLLRELTLPGGGTLRRGEVFVVRAVEPGGKLNRKFQISNHRAKLIPVKALACELVLDWKG